MATEGVEREEKVAAEGGVQRKGGCSRDHEGGKSEIQKREIQEKNEGIEESRKKVRMEGFF